jgi:4-amino-4-deoxy-L-arabinose transferase-like glycosyltransferase
VRLAILMLIVLAGLGLRVDSAWQGSSSNLPDSAAYERIARGLAEDGQFREQGPGSPPRPERASNYSPGLPLLVAGIFEIRGDDDTRLARVLLAIIGALSIPLTWLLARRLGGETAGLIGAAIIAFYPTLIGDAGMLLTESLAGTLILGAVLLLIRARDTGRPRDWVAPGILLGMASMVRPEYVAITVVLCAVIAAICVRRRPDASALVPASVLLVSALAVPAPWVIANSLDSGRIVPVSTGGGQALFTGSYLPSGGDPQKVVPHLLVSEPGLVSALADSSSSGEDTFATDRILSVMAERAHPGLATDAALSLMARHQYLDALRRQPAELAAFLFNKAHRIWWRGRSSLTDGLPGKLYHWAIAALSVIGLVGLARRRRFEFAVIAVLLIGATVIGMILVASPRRALVLWPLVASLGGVGMVMIASVLARIPGYRDRPVAIP